MKLVYLASPYSHKDRKIVNARHAINVVMAGYIMQGGSGEENINVFSPIAHSHFIAESGYLPAEWSFWRDKDLDILSRCDELYVMKIPGWQDSVGLKAEVLFAFECEIPVKELNVIRDFPLTSDIPESDWMYTDRGDLDIDVREFFLS